MRFVGLTTDGDERTLDAVRDFVDEYEIPWPTGYGARETILALGVSGFPTVIVVDGTGHVTWTDEQGGSLEEAIKAALVKRDAPTS